MGYREQVGTVQQFYILAQAYCHNELFHEVCMLQYTCDTKYRWMG